MAGTTNDDDDLMTNLFSPCCAILLVTPSKDQIYFFNNGRFPLFFPRVTTRQADPSTSRLSRRTARSRSDSRSRHHSEVALERLARSRMCVPAHPRIQGFLSACCLRLSLLGA